MRNIIVGNLDVFRKMAGHWNRRIVQEGFEYRFDIFVSEVWAEIHALQHPSWWDEQFFRSVMDENLDGFVFWCDVEEGKIEQTALITDEVPF